MKGRRPRPLDDGGLVDRTGSLFIPSFEPPLVYARFKRVRKSFCSILGVFKAEMQVFMPHDTIIPTGQNELSGYQKNFKFSSKTPLECTFEVATPPSPLPKPPSNYPQRLSAKRSALSFLRHPEPDPKEDVLPCREPAEGSERGNPGKLKKGAGESSRKPKIPTVPIVSAPAQSRAPDAAERPPPIFPYLRGEPGLLLFFLTFTKNALCAY